MGTTKKAVYKVHNGTDFDEIYFKTSEDMIVDAVQNLSGTGYRKLPGGLILQWGTFKLAAGVGFVQGTFPITFSKSVYAMLTTTKYESDTTIFYLTTPQLFNTSQFTIYIRDTLYNSVPKDNSAITYFALGK